MSDTLDSDSSDRNVDGGADEGEFAGALPDRDESAASDEHFVSGEDADSTDTFGEPSPGDGGSAERDGSDATLILDAPIGPADPLMVPMRWDAYGSAHHIGIELKHLEDEVRALLDPIDQRRKRKFNGTRRWHELEDDLRAIRFSGRLPEETIVKVLQLVAKRHTLYRRLSFLSSTRPTWNT